MALSDVSKEDVRKAIEEYRHIGEELFLKTYRFKKGKYWLIEEGRPYASKAILGVAHNKFTCERIGSKDYISTWMGAKRKKRLSGGKQTKKILEQEQLGFKVEHIPRKTTDSVKNTAALLPQEEPHSRSKGKNTGSVEHAKNLILFGPPGTGKTWKATRLALAIVRGAEAEEVEKEEGAQQEAERLRFGHDNPDGRIGMVTFHQNYSYEDFVEGIRPRLDGKGIAYELRQGIFLKTSNHSKTSVGSPPRRTRMGL